MSVSYSETIRRWAVDDRRAGVLADADGTGEVGLGAGEAGRKLAVRFALRVRAGRAETIRYQVFGCGFTIAACAAAADLTEGRSLEEIAALVPATVDAALAGLPPERGYCAELAVTALQAAAASASKDRLTVAVALAPDDEHAPRVTAENPVYRQLIDSPEPLDVLPADRHLFACLLAVAAGETDDIAIVLGLSHGDLADLLAFYFPDAAAAALLRRDVPAATSTDPELLRLLGEFLPVDADGMPPTPSLWLTQIMAARATRPGHLWLAMGLFARPELTAAIRRHLPALAAANHQGMRWKRFLFKQLCDQNGGTLCKAPDCGVCSDYPLCFEDN